MHPCRGEPDVLEQLLLLTGRDSAFEMGDTGGRHMRTVRGDRCPEKSVRWGGRGSEERGTREFSNGQRTFFVRCGGLDRQVSASRVSRLFEVKTGLQSPPTNSHFLRPVEGKVEAW